MAFAAPKIPVSVIVATRNEERRIRRCLAALHGFDEIIVLDSNSTDRTQEIAAASGAAIINFTWNGQYPKKRQWCLDNIALKHDWVFFVDADEILTPDLIGEIAALDFAAAGYFVPGLYIFENKPLHFGLKNNKLALFDRRKMHFPVVNDLDLPGMGEIEGHYQPVLKSTGHIDQLKNHLLHDAWDDPSAWQARHERYAAWEQGMNKNKAWPDGQRLIKRIFIALPLRSVIAFIHCYIFKLGFLHGPRGFRFAKTRFDYYRMI